VRLFVFAGKAPLRAVVGILLVSAAAHRLTIAKNESRSMG